MGTPLFAVVALPDHPTFLESLTYQATGLFVVFTVLGSIWLIMELLGAVFQRVAAAKVAPLAIPCPDGADVMAPEIVAVIAAASNEALQGQVRIVSIVPLTSGPDANPLPPWSGEGRRQHFASHKVR
jgi:hypothetical protein